MDRKIIIASVVTTLLVGQPATPTSLTATAGYAKVTLKWSQNSESDFAKYYIYGGTSASPTTKVDSTTSASDTTKTITGLTNGITYYYRISAVDNGGNESSKTSDVSATPLDTYPADTWARGLGGAGSDYGLSIAVDGSKNVYVTGYFEGTADFDPGSGTSNLTSSGKEDIFIAKYDSSGALLWAHGIGGSADDRGYGIAVDASDNVYLTGYFRETVDFDPGPGANNLTSAGREDIFFAKYNSSGELVWALGLGASFGDKSNSIALDASGNVYLTGSFHRTVDFDPGSGTTNLISGGGSDIFFAKYNSDGNLVWAKGLSGRNNDHGYSIKVDASENIYLTGDFIETVDFDPGSGTTNLTSNGHWDAFFAKYNAGGELVWVKSAGGSWIDRGSAITVDAGGNVLATGQFDGTVDFDPGSDAGNISGESDIFMVKYDSGGDLVWAKGIGAGHLDEGKGITVDAGGNVYLTGYFRLTVDFDPGSETTELTSNNVYDIFFAKYNSNGNLVWAKGVGGASSDIGKSISMDGSGNVFLTGYFSGTVDFDPISETTQLTSAGKSDVFIAKYRSDGSLDVSAPSIPTGLVATPGNGKVILTWNANRESGIAKYYIYGGTSASPTTKVDSTTSASDTTKTITGLTNGITYYYRISAVDNGGNESSKTSDVSATPSEFVITVKKDGTGNYATIQAAIDAASDGDTVLVYAGTYTENIKFNGKNILLKSNSGANHTVIKPANSSIAVVRFNDSETSSAILDGFHVRDGGNLRGSALSINDASPTIVNCIISHCTNTTDGSYGAVSFYYSASELKNCLIYNNLTGLFMDTNPHAPKIINCTITGNTTGFSGGSGSDGVLEVKNCIIYGNTQNTSNSMAVSYSSIGGGFSGTGNIDADPLFANPANSNYRLTDYSPCIGAGTATGAPSTDIEGNVRPSLKPDMGAYENSLSSRRPKSRTITDGLTATDLAYSNDTTTISAHWDSFEDDGAVTYEFAIGTYSKNNIKDWTANGSDTSTTVTGLELKNDSTYYFTVRGTDSDKQVSETATTDGVYIDNEKPVITDVSDAQWYGPDQAGQINVNATDNTRIAKYEFSVGSSAGSDNMAAWFTGDSSGASFNLSTFSEGINYYANARATDVVGNLSDVVSSDGFQMDLTAPVAGTVTAPKMAENEITLSWSGFSDEKSGISHYEYSLGDQPGSASEISRTNVSLKEAVTLTDLSLVHGKTYYGTIYAVDQVGNENSASSDGIMIDLYPGPPTISSVSLESGAQLRIFDEVNISFTASEPVQSMSPVLESVAGDDITFGQSINENVFSVSLQPPFTSGDEITLTINQLTDLAGNASDNHQYQYTISLLADFDMDGTIGVNDLNNFVNGWETKDLQYELGPVTGTAPYFKPALDGVYNTRDGMAFVRMWYWDKNKSGRMQVKLLPDQGAALNTSIENDHLLFHSPAGTRAMELTLNYSATDIQFAIPVIKEVSEQGITLSKVDSLEGHLILNAAYFEGNRTPVPIKFNHRQKKNIRVILTYQFLGKENVVLSAGSEELDLKPIPKEFALHQNYPNPFNPVTTINYDLPKDTDVKLIIYDILGREVVKLIDENIPAGYQSIVWNTKNYLGNQVSAGIYFYQIQTRQNTGGREKDFVKTRKMILLR